MDPSGNHPITTQPSNQLTMVATQPAGGDKLNALNKPFDLQGGNKRDWSFGLFDCFSDLETCCISCWCPCITFSTLKKRTLALESGNVDPKTPNYGEAIDQDCVGFCVLSYCSISTIVCQLPQRIATRNRYSIDGSDGLDCVTSCCCLPCVQTQEHRELLLEENVLLGRPLNMGTGNIASQTVDKARAAAVGNKTEGTAVGGGHESENSTLVDRDDLPGCCTDPSVGAAGDVIWWFP